MLNILICSLKIEIVAFMMLIDCSLILVSVLDLWITRIFNSAGDNFVLKVLRKTSLFCGSCKSLSLILASVQYYASRNFDFYQCRRRKCQRKSSLIGYTCAWGWISYSLILTSVLRQVANFDFYQCRRGKCQGKSSLIGCTKCTCAWGWISYSLILKSVLG
jgi:hypothetical protein